MIDTTGLVALIVAVVALVVAASQLAQQLLATGYVIRKCDSIVTGGLTKGGKRQWHWRQFRFTVVFQSIIFSLPSKLYTSLGLSPTVQVNMAAPEIYDRAIKTRLRQGTGQACWVSFLQDLVQYECVTADDICLKGESADRVPDDLTVAPTRVDAVTILLSCIAMGMQVFKYSPTTGEVTLGGGCGSISSSAHPVLGGLLRYSVFSDEPAIGLHKARLHSSALRSEQGVWANAVFGLFRNRAYRPEYHPLGVYRDLYEKTLQENNWPINSVNDTIGGAACFLTFADVDCYITVPPSVVRPWCAHFAESILMIEYWDMWTLLAGENEEALVKIAASPALVGTFENFLGHQGDTYAKGYSSPHLDTSEIERPVQQFVVEGLDQFSNFKSALMTPEIIETLRKLPPVVNNYYNEDPSTFVSPEICWEQIQRLNKLQRALASHDRTLKRLSQQIVARAIAPMAEVAAPSWQTSSYAEMFFAFQKHFEHAADEVVDEWSDKGKAETLFIQALRYHAYFKMMRACYFTIMMRSAHDIGPGLSEDSKLETSLLYMA